MKAKIKVGDEVLVTTGSDKGRKGPVLAVDILKMKIRVKGVRVQTCFDKKEGIQKKEGFIDYSNAKLVKAVDPGKKRKAAAEKKPKKALFTK